MPGPLSGFLGFVGILAVIAVAVLIFSVIGALGEIGIFAVLLNGALAIAGLAIIANFASSPFGWLIGSIPLAIGSFNVWWMVSNIAKHGTADPLE